ncbi:hypothetical protein [uncultured Microbacterium sp.]|uniref:hypothetical protein n=1 Tax=uncultured Microbacterium sp. TaxID=191216 RepID=UPI0028D002A0|nr:hypothetical protein [uncultured Microbacterium sp.]
MPDEKITFLLSHVFGDRSHRIDEIAVAGQPSDSAHTALVEALRTSGHDYDGVTGFTLSMRDDFDSDSAPDTQFLVLSGTETLGELRLIIGPDDSAVILRSGGFGGGDFQEVLRWTVEDFLPQMSTLLEVYGAVQMARDVGRSVESRRNRQTRRDADYWLRNGKRAVPDYLLNAVQARVSWPAGELSRVFGLGSSDAADLMHACGFKYNSASLEYFYAGGNP